MQKHAIILAAGKGTRMKIDGPKCAYPVCGKPMAQYIIDSCKECGIDDLVVVVGYKREQLIECLSGDIRFAYQEEQKGTGHAVICAMDSLSNTDGLTLIFPGDMPLVGDEIINNVIKDHLNKNNDLTVVTTNYDDPGYYGRIYRENGMVKKIVEYKDCNPEQLKIKEINSGLYCVKTNLLLDALKKIKPNNNQNEYYLTDIVEIMGANYKVDSYQVDNDYHLIGINDMKTLVKVEAYCNNK